MAEAKLTSTLLSHADLEVILNGVKAYIDAEVAKAGGDTSAVAAKVNTLIGSVAGDDAKSVRVISAEEVAKIVADADANFDTLKEIADWIMSDTTGAAKMANDIASALEQIGNKADGEAEASGLYKLIADEVARATQAESDINAIIEENEQTTSVSLTDHNTRIEALEAKFTGEDSVESQVNAAMQEAINTAAEDATTKVNTLKDTTVNSTNTSGPVTATIGGTVGAPIIGVSVNMASEEQVTTLANIFAVAESEPVLEA